MTRCEVKSFSISTFLQQKQQILFILFQFWGFSFFGLKLVSKVLSFFSLHSSHSQLSRERLLHGWLKKLLATTHIYLYNKLLLQLLLLLPSCTFFLPFSSHQITKHLHSWPEKKSSKLKARNLESATPAAAVAEEEEEKEEPFKRTYWSCMDGWLSCLGLSTIQNLLLLLLHYTITSPSSFLFLLLRISFATPDFGFHTSIPPKRAKKLKNKTTAFFYTSGVGF